MHAMIMQGARGAQMQDDVTRQAATSEFGDSWTDDGSRHQCNQVCVVLFWGIHWTTTYCIRVLLGHLHKKFTTRKQPESASVGSFHDPANMQITANYYLVKLANTNKTILKHTHVPWEARNSLTQPKVDLLATTDKQYMELQLSLTSQAPA